MTTRALIGSSEAYPYAPGVQFHHLGDGPLQFSQYSTTPKSDRAKEHEEIIGLVQTYAVYLNGRKGSLYLPEKENRAQGLVQDSVA